MNYETCEWRFVEQHLDQSRDPAALRALARIDAAEALLVKTSEALEEFQTELSALLFDAGEGELQGDALVERLEQLQGALPDPPDLDDLDD